MLKDIKIRTDQHIELMLLKNLHGKRNMPEVMDMLLEKWRKNA